MRFLYNFYRTYDPQTGRYLEADPVGQEAGFNLYPYVEDDPLNQADPWGLTTFACKKALDALGGNEPDAGTRSGPDIPGNPFYHKYVCVERSGNISCGGQTAAGTGLRRAFNEGLPSQDVFDPDKCEPIGADDCVENCLLAVLSGERPKYGLLGPGTNCKEWSNNALAFCERLCRKRKR